VKRLSFASQFIPPAVVCFLWFCVARANAADSDSHVRTRVHTHKRTRANANPQRSKCIDERWRVGNAATARSHNKTITITTMFHVMGSPYNHNNNNNNNSNSNSNSTELKKIPAYLRPPRRPLKETPPWKDALKHSCLERARRQRQEDAISSRRRRRFHDFHHERARNVVQEELHECGIGIRGIGGGGGGGGAEEEEMEQLMQRHYSMQTPHKNDKEQQQQDDQYEISQDELYELMQQVEEELLRQGTSIVSTMFRLYCKYDTAKNISCC
jgi:hypothetical protein